ncbi:GNAT family N-acetyltransferase [Pacificimonas sp. WHA3]|uniref:GNAT family N-acetyltransferase n=1 Tax=Pacificimonas pallii TaxID=2827236 RepID=A0ABS6SBU1_9SPHN|nr:GNAT family N-acetyltransferase [Pacificimonas pallii]MBV7255558.1 GNAT family N-acetyltransferase [Pacificimonas pallii]
MTRITYRTPTGADLEELCQLASDIFSGTFGHLYPAEDLNAFLREAFGPAGMSAEFSDPEYQFRVAEADGRLIGYVKLGPPSLPVPDDGRSRIELRQLYVSPAFHGTGVAAALMDWALDRARRSGRDDCYLSVYSDNPRAQAFYRRYGFEEVGRFHFMVGRTADDERLWRLALSD